MPGIEFERETSFDIPDKTAEVIEGISKTKLRNSILAYCGREIEQTYKAAQECRITDLVKGLQVVGDVTSHLEEIQSGNEEIFENLINFFSLDIATILVEKCNCERG